MKTSAGRNSNFWHMSNVPSTKVPRSRFNRSFSHKTTFVSGMLIPFLWDPVLPADTMRVQSQFITRLATPQFPIMDNIYFDVHYWFVPYRLVWENWERFISGWDFANDPTHAQDFLVPQLEYSSNYEIAPGFLLDYFGLPYGDVWKSQDNMPSALPLRAFHLIYNEWYRDENWVADVACPTDDGPDDPSIYESSKLYRGRRKDYFTSCLPWPQKGPAVHIPLASGGGILPVRVDTTPGVGNIGVLDSGDNPRQLVAATSIGITTGAPDEVLYTELGADALATVNQLREANQIQRLLEKDARGGTRYTEFLYAHFGVVSPDFRLQRPEYLGGGQDVVNINPVAQTAASVEDGSPQGNLAAYGVHRGRHGFNHTFVEYGVVIGICSVRTDYTYQQRLDREWSRRTRYDFYLPSLAHLGEQAVLNKEICMSDTNASVNNSVFGYNERWSEYKVKTSMITGQFRSEHALTLDAWHLGFDFNDTAPLLGSFVNEITEIPRVLAVQDPDVPEFIMDSHHYIEHTRAMPAYSIPGLGDRF